MKGCDICKKNPCDKHTEVNGKCIDFEEKEMTVEELELLSAKLRAATIDCDLQRVDNMNVNLTRRELVYLHNNGISQKLSK